jgi:hypothetical protein
MAKFKLLNKLKEESNVDSIWDLQEFIPHHMGPKFQSADGGKNSKNEDKSNIQFAKMNDYESAIDQLTSAYSIQNTPHKPSQKIKSPQRPASVRQRLRNLSQQN